eukprot:scaffold36299_cov145-Isochrysis_galbana.AAC.1
MGMDGAKIAAHPPLWPYELYLELEPPVAPIPHAAEHGLKERAHVPRVELHVAPVLDCEQNVHVRVLALRPDLTAGVHTHLVHVGLVGVRQVRRLLLAFPPVKVLRRIGFAGRRDSGPLSARYAVRHDALARLDANELLPKHEHLAQVLVGEERLDGAPHLLQHGARLSLVGHWPVQGPRDEEPRLCEPAPLEAGRAIPLLTFALRHPVLVAGPLTRALVVDNFG